MDDPLVTTWMVVILSTHFQRSVYKWTSKYCASNNKKVERAYSFMKCHTPNWNGRTFNVKFERILKAVGASSWAKVIAHCVHDHYYLEYNSEEDSLCHARVFDKRVSEQNLCKTFEKHQSHCCPFVSKYKSSRLGTKITICILRIKVA